MQIAQEVGGSVGLGFRVEAPVHPAIDDEPVDLGRVGCELPQAGGGSSGVRGRIEAALDHRDPHEVLGQRLAPKRPADHLPPTAGVPEQVREGGAPSRVIVEVLDVANDPLVPPHRDVGHLELRQPAEISGLLGGRGFERPRRRQAGSDDAWLGLLAEGHEQRK